MKEYRIKRGLSHDIERIKEILVREFQVEVTEEGGTLSLSYGALKELKVWIEGGKLFVETQANLDATDEMILDTNRRFRRFLDDATGYSTKERRKMMME
ncbi:MAG: DUF5611 family protein [Archaeoglobi archaeon]|nr:DUF5611 family protein [Candidatus Mnemosynella sp.]